MQINNSGYHSTSVTLALELNDLDKTCTMKIISKSVGVTTYCVSANVPILTVEDFKCAQSWMTDNINSNLHV